MNPLPFFPPPTRAFSQQGRNPHTNSSESRNLPSSSSTSRRTGSGGPPSSGGHFSNLRATLSQHGLRDSSNSPAPNSRASRPGSGGMRTPSYSVAGSTQGSPYASTLQVNTAGGTGQVDNTISETSSSSSGGERAGDASPASAQPMTPGGERSEVPSGSSAPSMFRRPSRTTTSNLSVPSGRTGMNLPKGLFFDWIRGDEVAQCHALETQAYDPEDQASKERMKYRQANAPHLFLGAYIPSPPPKVAGPLSVGHYSTPRRIIGFINGTASSSLSARALAVHTVSNEEEGAEAWMVCLASIVVEEQYRRKGVGLRMLEEYHMRLRRAEEGRGDQKRGLLEQPKGYECVGVLTHEETIKFFLKAGFKVQGVSHVRVGSGGWVEMRRYLKGKPPQQDKPQEGLQTDKAQMMEATSSADGDVKKVASDPTEAKQSEEKAITNNEVERSAVEESSSAPATPRKGAAANLKDLLFESPSAASPPEKSAPTARSPPASRAASGSNLGTFSQSDLLAALSASSAGYAPGTNPSQPFSSILGQTLAGKTFVEDAYVALEARLVDKRKGKYEDDDKGSGGNLAEIWCPQEKCGCKLIRKGVAMWELAESGPLTDSRLCNDSLPSGAAALPPTPQPPPAPASHIRALQERERQRAKRSTKGGSDEEDNTRSTLPGAPPSGEVTTPIRPFWSLLSPMSFENIGFSRDVQWKVPLPPMAAGGMTRSASGDDEMVASPTSMAHSTSSHGNNVGGANGFFASDHHGSGSSSSNTKSSGAGGEGAGAGASGGAAGSSSTLPERETPRKKPSRRPTLFGRKNTEKEKEKSSSALAGLKIQHPADLMAAQAAADAAYFGGASASASTGAGAGRARTPSGGAGSGSGSDPSAQSQQQQTLTIKYLLCPNCDTGPLGYTIVPASMQGGKMGLAVGEEMNGGAAGGGGAGGMQELQIFLLAAERVRYRFVK